MVKQVLLDSGTHKSYPRTSTGQALNAHAQRGGSDWGPRARGRCQVTQGRPSRRARERDEERVVRAAVRFVTLCARLFGRVKFARNWRQRLARAAHGLIDTREQYIPNS